MCLKQGRLSLKNAFLYFAGFPNHVLGEKAELELILFNDAWSQNIHHIMYDIFTRRVSNHKIRYNFMPDMCNEQSTL